MKRCINIDTQIIVSMQLSTDHLPKKFNYTCFFWLPNCGIFTEYSKLVACGTQEGAIVIIGKKKTNFEFVSLLIGHESEITDICIFNKSGLFLSISKDSKICGWSLLDFSCEFQIKLNLNFGFYTFSLYPTELKYIWITRFGESIFLVDTEEGEVVHQFQYPGIQSFEALCSHPNLNNSPVYGVCVGSIQTTIFLIENKSNFIEQKTIFNNEKIIEPHQIIKAFQYGIIKISKNQIDIIKANPKLKIRYHGTFSELPDDDFIKSVYFNNSHTLITACSYFGRFFILNLKNGFKSISIKYIYPFSNPLFIGSSYAINNQQEIIFFHSKSLLIINDQKQIEKVVFDKSIEKVTHMNSDQNSYFLTSQGSLLSFVSIETQKPFRTIQFHRTITSIFERKIGPSNQAQIVIGFDNGSVCFYSNYAKFITILTAPVQCFISSQTKTDLIAIGTDGSACLFREDFSYLSFDTPLVPIKFIHYIPNVDLYSFGFDDGSFLIYSTIRPEPIEIVMKLPDKAKLIWPKLIEKGCKNDFCSSFCVNFGMKSVAYEIFNIPSLCKIVRENFFQFERNLMEDESAKKKVKHMIGCCHCIYNLLKGKEMNSNGSNLTFIGSNDQPTFFYDSFHFNGEMICDISPFLGSSFFISSTLISDAINSDEVLVQMDAQFFSKISFLPSLIQFIYYPDEVVKRTVCRLCILLSNYVSLQTCQYYFIRFTLLENLENVEEYDKFLMSLLIFRFPNTLPSSFINELYEFLDELTVNISEQAVLAISILIDGISFWGNKTKKKEEIYITIIESMLRQKRSIFLCNKFYNVACSDMDSLIKSFPILISTYIEDDEMIENIFNLYTNIAFKNQKLCGSLISDLFALQCTKFPQLFEIVSAKIEGLSKIFQFVKVVDKFFLIGLSDSIVHAYNEGKLIFNEQVFTENTDISFVHIGPQKKFGVAVSAKLKKATTFCLIKTNKRLFRTNSKISNKEFAVHDITNVNYFHAYWIDDENCEITVRHTKK